MAIATVPFAGRKVTGKNGEGETDSRKNKNSTKRFKLFPETRKKERELLIVAQGEGE